MRKGPIISWNLEPDKDKLNRIIIKLTAAHLVMKYPDFYVAQIFVIIFIRVLFWGD
jgi:hypothetical protein